MLSAFDFFPHHKSALSDLSLIAILGKGEADRRGYWTLDSEKMK